jgi:type IV pilus assembly protein PilQ
MSPESRRQFEHILLRGGARAPAALTALLSWLGAASARLALVLLLLSAVARTTAAAPATVTDPATAGKLADVQSALARARAARLADERTLAELKRAQAKAEGELARARAKAIAGKDKVPSAAKATAAAATVKDIRFVDGSATARIEIQLDGAPLAHRLLRQNGSPVLALEGARLPRLLQRTLDTTEFGGPVEQITSYVPQAAQATAHVKVALRAASRSGEGTLRREGDRLLVWEFAKPKPAAKASFAAAPAGGGAYALSPSQVAAQRARRRPTATSPANIRHYAGRRIDLDFKDADIHNILRLLSDVGNVNIITSDTVQGRVTIRMKNVPWDQALDVILRAKGFGQVREGNLIRIALAADLEKEREAEIARLKQVQLLRPLETRLIPLSYAKANAVIDKLQYTMSSRGKLTIDERTNMVIARDIAGNLDLMERLLRNLDTQTPQVLIEARIVEARTNYSKEIGVQWGGSFLASPGTGNATGLVFPNTLGIGGGATDSNAPLTGLRPTPTNPGFVVNMPASTGTGRGAAVGLTLGSVSGAVNINLRLSAAESSGDIRIVSAPKITTLDNVEARIEQGVTIPFSQVSAAGVQTTFQDAKLSLTVKPHVTADGSIMMTVQVTRNEPDFANTGPRGEPTILRKEAKTEMLVKDGDTSVIGGIYTTRTGRNQQRVPWFADIPIFGWFFRQTRETADREEVLVFITPRIVNRAQSIGR